MGRGREQQLQPRKGAAPGERVGGSCAGAACEGGPYDVPRWPPLRRRCQWALQVLIAAILQGIRFFIVGARAPTVSWSHQPSNRSPCCKRFAGAMKDRDNMMAWWRFHTWIWCAHKCWILHGSLLDCLCALRLYWCLAKSACFRRACKQGL